MMYGLLEHGWGFIAAIDFASDSEDGINRS